MTDITREEFPREFPIFPKETTTPRLTDIEPDQETVVPEMQETSSKVRIQSVTMVCVALVIYKILQLLYFVTKIVLTYCEKNMF